MTGSPDLLGVHLFVRDLEADRRRERARAGGGDGGTAPLTEA